MTISRDSLIASARHACVAAILILLFASAAWGQEEPDLRVSTLTKQLKQGDSFVRWRAAKALLKIGSYSKAAVPALIEALKIEEGDISERARDELVKIGPDAVSALINLLKYRDSPAHSKAIEALTAIGPPAVPLLIEALKDPDDDMRLGALEALRGISLQEVNPRPTTLLSILIEALKDPNPAIRGAAAQTVSRLGAEAAPAYPALIEALKDHDPDVRRKSADALSCDAAIAPLLEALENQDADVRSGAAYALGCIALHAKPVLDALIKASKDPDAKVRYSVISSFLTAGMIERKDAAVVATWLEGLKDTDKSVRRVAAYALGTAPSAAAITALIVALQDSEAAVRRSAAEALAKREAGDAVPRLIQLMGDREAEVRNAARNALAAIGPARAAAALAGALKHQDGNIRVGATLILHNFGLYPRALGALVEALKDQDATVRSTALLSILSFANGPDRESAIPALIKALENADQHIRLRAALALSGVKSGEHRYPDFGELPKAVIPVLPKQVISILIEALKDQDPVVRSDAAWALAGIGPAAKAAAPALIESIEDRNLEVCRYATYALKNIGARSPAIISALIKLLKHPDGGIRDVVRETLASIGAPAVPPLVRLLLGQDSALRFESYYALVSIGDVFALVATLKSRDKALRSRVLEVIEDIRVDPARGIQAPDLLFDPSRKYLFQTVRIPCTYEGDGRAIFVSELDTGTSFPILASSGGLGPSRFIQSGGRYYLVIDESGGEADCSTGSFWLYDFKTNQFVIHAEGEIGEAERGVFPLIYCEGDKATRVGTVTVKNLLNRERPLRLLPRPRHGLTLRKNTTATDRCNQTVIIRNAGTRVLITEKLEDGSYEVYYKGAIATIPKGSLKTTK